MMRRFFGIIGDVLLYYLIAWGVGFLVDKIIGLDMPIWQYAIVLTIGWSIWQTIKFVLKKIKNQRCKT